MDSEEAISLVRSIENYDRRLECGAYGIGDDSKMIDVYAGDQCVVEIRYPEDWSAFLVANPSLDKFFV